MLSQKSRSVDAIYNFIQSIFKGVGRGGTLNFFQTCFGVLSRKIPSISGRRKSKQYRSQLKNSKHSLFFKSRNSSPTPLPAPTPAGQKK